MGETFMNLNFLQAFSTLMIGPDEHLAIEVADANDPPSLQAVAPIDTWHI